MVHIVANDLAKASSINRSFYAEQPSSAVVRTPSALLTCMSVVLSLSLIREAEEEEEKEHGRSLPSTSILTETREEFISYRHGEMFGTPLVRKILNYA